MAECDGFYCDDSAHVLATQAGGVRLAGIPGEIDGDLGERAAVSSPAGPTRDERLFCLNLGMALEDVVAGELALRRARELGVGGSCRCSGPGPAGCGAAVRRRDRRARTAAARAARRSRSPRRGAPPRRGRRAADAA